MSQSWQPGPAHRDHGHRPAASARPAGAPTLCLWCGGDWAPRTYCPHPRALATGAFRAPVRRSTDLPAPAGRFSAAELLAVYMRGHAQTVGAERCPCFTCAEARALFEAVDRDQGAREP